MAGTAGIRWLPARVKLWRAGARHPTSPTAKVVHKAPTLKTAEVEEVLGTGLVTW